MKVLLTGGSGDLGDIVIPQLLTRGDEVINLDVSKPRTGTGSGASFLEGSILDRPLLKSAFSKVECVVHIAAWHGIHEFRKEKNAFDFWDLNVTGTLNVLESCVRAGVPNLVFISSTSVDEWPGVYGHSKLVGEELVRTYIARHGLRVITLRPRAFIPHSNKLVYKAFPEWASWYWKGAVHIKDVAQALLQAVSKVPAVSLDERLPLVIDGRCDFTEQELARWDLLGPGTTFKHHFGEDLFALARKAGLDPAAKPKMLGYGDAEAMIGYQPQYGFAEMLTELEEYYAAVV